MTLQFPTTIPAAVADSGLNPDALAADDWRLHMATTGRAPTQTWAAGLIAQGHVALRVPSFAPHRRPGRAKPGALAPGRRQASAQRPPGRAAALASGTTADHFGPSPVEADRVASRGGLSRAVRSG